MKIDSSINQHRFNQNFTSIRVVKTSPQEFVYFAKNFKDFCRNNTVFRAESFEQSNFWDHLKKVASKEQTSQRWVINNAVRHNLISYDTLTNLPMLVFTGKDKIKLTLYNIKNFIPNLVRIWKLAGKAYEENFPAHLCNAKVYKDLADIDMPKFKKFLKRNNAKHVSFDEFVNEVKAGQI